MPTDSFWEKLKKPLIGLAPMDGVTDGAMREITDKYGHPDVIFTEFVPVAAIKKGIVKVLYSLRHHQTKTPRVAQFFGTDPAAFYQAVFVAAELGYDGVDINMGCPDRGVTKRGGGAGLILNPAPAKQIIQSCKQAAKDWGEGKLASRVGLSESILNFIRVFKVNTQQVAVAEGFPTARTKKHWREGERLTESVVRHIIPISVKTRIGYDKPITEQWIGQLLEAGPAAITLHGRTLKQLYHGRADWNEIALAAKLCKKTRTLLIGNGDIKSVSYAKDKAKQYGVDGVLIGRAALGNPWVFAGKTPTTQERFQVMVEHCRRFLAYRPDLKIFPMRKHLTWYCKGFAGAAEMRDKLMKADSLASIKHIILQYAP
ncbi:tRNA-dihydrouridine synthase [Patescibacteria group bacterium]|nr:tRNA-dihydrouridine synthase [Patescibacteria group bacterium]MCL5091591.1 tRNA-dihydrouridine synthase [Patescibacteria group bacterium]